jgi:acyl-CoA thioesterase-1
MRFILTAFLFFTANGFAADTKTAAVPAQAPVLKRIVIIGDSITEGYGVSRDQAYPALIQKSADNDKKKWQVINAGISGSTSASAVSRINWHLKNPPGAIVLALGANDGLRGNDPADLEKNLVEAIELCQAQGVKVVLAGMKMPPNYGKDYKQKFESIYPRISKRFKVPLLTFLLDGVAGQSGLNLADGIHPNEKGHAIIAAKLYPFLKKTL